MSTTRVDECFLLCKMVCRPVSGLVPLTGDASSRRCSILYLICSRFVCCFNFIYSYSSLISCSYFLSSAIILNFSCSTCILFFMSRSFCSLDRRAISSWAAFCLFSYSSKSASSSGVIGYWKKPTTSSRFLAIDE